MYRRLVAIGALATLTSGCSMVLVKGPPGYIPANDPVPLGACTTGRLIPLIDAVGSVAGVATALTSDDGNAVRFGAVLGAGLGFSSYTGFRKVGACRKRVDFAFAERRSLALLTNTVSGVPTMYSRPDTGVLPGGPVFAQPLLRPAAGTPLFRPDPGFLTMPWPRVQPLGTTFAPVRPRW